MAFNGNWFSPIHSYSALFRLVRSDCLKALDKTNYRYIHCWLANYMLSSKYFLHSRFLSVIKVFSFFPLLSPDCLRWLVMSGRLFAGELTRPRTMDWPITLHTDTHADKQSLGLQCLVLIVKHWITRQILTQLDNLTEILSVEKNRNECALELY